MRSPNSCSSQRTEFVTSRTERTRSPTTSQRSSSGITVHSALSMPLSSDTSWRIRHWRCWRGSCEAPTLTIEASRRNRQGCMRRRRAFRRQAATTSTTWRVSSRCTTHSTHSAARKRRRRRGPACSSSVSTARRRAWWARRTSAASPQSRVSRSTRSPQAPSQILCWRRAPSRGWPLRG